jgi:hypothetical protein
MLFVDCYVNARSNISTARALPPVLMISSTMTSASTADSLIDEMRSSHVLMRHLSLDSVAHDDFVVADAADAAAAAAAAAVDDDDDDDDDDCVDVCTRRLSSALRWLASSCAYSERVRVLIMFVL